MMSEGQGDQAAKDTQDSSPTFSPLTSEQWHDTGVMDNPSCDDEMIGLLGVTALDTCLEYQHQESVHYPSPVSGEVLEHNSAAVEDKAAAVKGVCGLHNLGNTCFMNAGLQCLLSNSHIVQHFLHLMGRTDYMSETLANQLGQLVLSVWGGGQSVLKPREFKDTLGIYHSQFKDQRQHDCQEFLALLLNSLHEQLLCKSAVSKCVSMTTDQAACSATACRSEVASAEPEESSTANNIPVCSGGDAQVNSCATNLTKDTTNQDREPTNPCLTAGRVLCTEISKDIDQSSFQSDISKPFAFTVNVGNTNSLKEESDQGKLPSIEDLYMKDTKTLNTNVLATELMYEEVTTDSEKFHKQDNIMSSSQEQLSGITQLLITNKATSPKHVKDTNLLANVKGKFTDDDYSKKYLYADDADLCFNNSKRMRMEEKEKNVIMQARLKVNTAKFPAQSTSADSLNNSRKILKPIRNPCNQSEEPWTSQACQSSQPIEVDSDSEEEEDKIKNSFIEEAEKAWTQYIDKNHSIVVNTFQGQFKSTVVCSVCHHVSVTFEPFMYLSLPLPHAMERQISVTFVPCTPGVSVTRYLLTLNKQDKVQQMHESLVTLLLGSTNCFVLAEVFGYHVSRFLEDHMLLRYVNDYNRTIYAFEMLPPASKQEDNPSSVAAVSSVDQPGISSMTHMGSGGEPLEPVGASGDMVLNNQCNMYSNTEPVAGITRLNNRDDGQDSHTDKLQAVDNTEAQKTAGHTEVSPAGDQTESVGLQEAGSGGTVESTGLLQASSGGTVEETAKFGDQWKSCAICLEEMADTELMVHTTCGGTLCHTCLEMSFKHYGESSFTCPVCNACPVKPMEDFIQMDAMSSYKPKTRILRVPVLYCNVESNEGQSKLVGHPSVLYLKSNLLGQELYDSVSGRLRINATHTILLTDGQGLQCSRCLYTRHCPGCKVPCDETEITLQPGDHITVRFGDLNPQQLAVLQHVMDHVTMEKLRPDEPLTIYDCFEAFTESETLDEANPWYCPECQQNQCAKKTLSVWRFPNTLVVYLKRFVFHDLVGMKIDNKVVFPLENLDLTEYMSGPYHEGLQYDLQSCVCHFGGASAGHYTAYARHPLTGQWWHYNDETVIQNSPLEEDYCNGYILFYQKQGTDVHFIPPEK